MTLHAAKGLEFPTVFLVGFEEELLPHRSNAEGPGLEEERRLAYVGITRARQRLFVTYARWRKRYAKRWSALPAGSWRSCRARRWSRAGRVELTADEKQARGRSALAGLRSLLES